MINTIEVCLRKHIYTVILKIFLCAIKTFKYHRRKLLLSRFVELYFKFELT